MDKLVSIVTPCFNGGKYLKNYFESIIAQDYNNCELIFINDGSTDDSEKIAMYYKENLEDKGIRVRYFYQKNQGLGKAIAVGFQHVQGDYIIWPDCDDTMPSDSISKKVEFLENHPNYGVVRTDGVVVDEEFPDKVIRYCSLKRRGRFNENVFEDYLFGNNAWLMPGCFMLRTKALDNCNPQRYIYPTRAGQDWQILLPVFYHYKCGFIDESLYTYILHKGSLSYSAEETYEQKIKRKNDHEDIIINTLQNMNIIDVYKYVNKVKAYYIKRYFGLSVIYMKPNDAKKYYLLLKKYENISLVRKIEYWASLYKSLNKTMMILRFMRNKFVRWVK
jgi:glycosyltransferase involved in cell wall biosynthesis